MKAKVDHSFNIGGYSLTTSTVLFARKINGQWYVHLNYNSLTIKTEEPDEDTPTLLRDGFTIQSSRPDDIVAGVVTTLGLVGVVSNVISLIQGVIEILGDISSLVDKIIEWVNDAISKIIAGEEPIERTLLENTLFVFNLLKDGTRVERRRPRWRKKYNALLSS